MAEKLESASQKVTPRDAQKGGQGALGKDHPEIALKQDGPQADNIPLRNQQPSGGLTADQIALLCEIEEQDASEVTRDKKTDIERLLSEGYIEPADASPGPRFRLTAKGGNLLAKRGVGVNEA